MASAAVVILAVAAWRVIPWLSTRGDVTARVLIPKGATFRDAADSLAAARVIRWPRLFSLYGTLRKRDRTIRAGTYAVAERMSWDALISALHTGKGATRTVTVPEGWALMQIVPHLARTMDVAPASLESAVRDSALRARLGVPTETLEGYLFPDTYVFAVGSTARQIVAAMVTRFERMWRPEWDAQLTTLKRSRHEIVTLASIVEKEVRRGEERPIVAGVYWNRLRIGMALQADPTVIFALGRSSMRVRYSDLNVKSPYNTYRNAGLPPGPIAAPGAAALAATITPAKVPFRYFVARPDGRHEFRTTYAEHLAAVQRIRAEARADSIRRARGDTAVRGDTAARRDSTR